MLILFDGLYYWDGIGLKLSPVGCCHSFLFGLSREYWTGDNRKQKREQNPESSVRYHQWYNKGCGRSQTERAYRRCNGTYARVISLPPLYEQGGHGVSRADIIRGRYFLAPRTKKGDLHG